MNNKFVTTLVLLVLSFQTNMAWSLPQDLVIETLKDPESARFKDVRKFPNGNACGLVNAKNGYGGYVGFKPWSVINGKANLEEVSLEVGCFKAEKPAAYAEKVRSEIAAREQKGYSICKPLKEQFIQLALGSTTNYLKRFQVSDLSRIVLITYEERNEYKSIKNQARLENCGNRFKNEILVDINKQNEVRYQEKCENEFEFLLDESPRVINTLPDFCGQDFYQRVAQKRTAIFNQQLKVKTEIEEAEKAAFQLEISNPHQSTAAKLCRHRKKLLSEISANDRAELISIYEKECSGIPH